MTEKNEFGSIKMLSVLDDLFNKACDLLWECIPSKFKERPSEICGLFLSLCETGKGISILGKQGLLVNESYMLARAFFEKSLNASYLLVCDSDDFDSFLEYSFQKSYRILNRDTAFHSEFSKYLYPGLGQKLPKYSELETQLQNFSLKHPKLAKALKKYTSTNGKEITHWTKKNIDERIDLIEEKRGGHVDAIRIAKSSIYDKASEALHGTMFGVLFHIGVYNPGKKASTKEMFIQEARNNMVVLLQCNLVLILDLMKQLQPYCINESLVQDFKSLSKEFQEKATPLFEV